MGAREQVGHDQLRALPAVHELLAGLNGPRALAVVAARQAIEERRAAILDGRADGEDLSERAQRVLDELRRGSLRRVLNATGVVIHTNLGRAPLASAAHEAVNRVAEGYSNLELRLDTGTRGSRQAHVDGLLRELTGAQAAMIVNNGAAAVLLAAGALAGPGRTIIVSRGQLVEIGGGFRIPEVVSQSGARLVEVGTTNRTRLSDYARAIESQETSDAVILRVHQSNFRTLGFVQDVAIEDLCGLGVPVIDDLGSGVLADGDEIPALAEEPAVRRSIKAGAALVCCSGDKLLGGPQAGLLMGTQEAVAAAREHPLARALRIDKLSLAALEATLNCYRDPVQACTGIPVQAMLRASEGELAHRAHKLRAAIGTEAAELGRASGKVGGGALPLLELEGPVVTIGPESDPVALVRALREGQPPVIARVSDGRLLLDPRTLAEDELELAGAAVRAALGLGSR